MIATAAVRRLRCSPNFDSASEVLGDNRLFCARVRTVQDSYRMMDNSTNSLVAELLVLSSQDYVWLGEVPRILPCSALKARRTRGRQRSMPSASSSHVGIGLPGNSVLGDSLLGAARRLRPLRPSRMLGLRVDSSRRRRSVGLRSHRQAL